MKSAIFGFNGARHHHPDLHAAANDIPRDRITKWKAAYQENSGGSSKAADGYVIKPA